MKIGTARFCCFLAFVLEISYAMSSAATTMNRILVTGGNKGIGKAICERLLTEWKNTHVLMGSRDKARGEKAVAEIVKKLGGDCKDRLELIVLDTSSDASVKEAAQGFEGSGGNLDGIINNAGIGWGYTMKETVNTNYFGPRRVNEAFGKFLKRPGGRIVNVASASGPNFLSDLPDNSSLKALLAKPWTIPGGIAEVDQLARSMTHDGGNAYGASKALLNAYTVIHAKLDKDLIINSVTPGYILTDLTKNAPGAKPPSQGAIPPCYLMMDEDVVPKLPSGRYYGSDCVRSPLSFYRGPGEPAFESDEDLVELPKSALKMATVL